MKEKREEEELIWKIFTQPLNKLLILQKLKFNYSSSHIQYTLQYTDSEEPIATLSISQNTYT